LSFFFFQAEDGIRDKLVTGVQTCALPIFFSLQSDRSRVYPLAPQLLRSLAHRRKAGPSSRNATRSSSSTRRLPGRQTTYVRDGRSEERRVGKECGCGGWPEEEKERRERI